VSEMIDMDFLEHKIPPPIVGVAIGLAMWGCARISPELPHWFAFHLLPIAEGIRLPLAATVGSAGLLVALAGRSAFQKARTTVNPMKLEAASSLVVSGVYYPVTVLPDWMQWLSVISPATYTLEGCRNAILNGASVSQMWPDIWPLLVIGGIAVPLGLAVFRRGERYAKQHGRLKRSG